MNFPFLRAKERLIRIMGTFDLATGHADTWDDLLDSLESELRDVLGHYRAALAQPAQEPVGVVQHKLTATFGADYEQVAVFCRALDAGTHLYTTQPQRPWVGLTDDEQSFVYDKIHEPPRNKPFWVAFACAIEAKLKEKNT